jgi:exodeoxyribonuclease-3
MVKRKVPAKAGESTSDSFRVASWNVNGIRACATKGFTDWLGDSGADVVGLQETRIMPDQVDETLRSHGAYSSHWTAGEKPGYSGVGFYTKHPLSEVETTFGVPVLDTEGRLIVGKFGALTIVNGYFPNGSGKDRDNSRVPYKLDFYRELYAWLEPKRARGEPILVMGDMNTAHRAIDLARPKQNEKTSGFLAEERDELDRWIRNGWTDTFRHHEPGEGHYTWWSQRFGVREKNIGWRIDYVLASEAAMKFVRSAKIHPEVRGSDHCPISVELDRAVLTATTTAVSKKAAGTKPK